MARRFRWTAAVAAAVLVPGGIIATTALGGPAAAAGPAFTAAPYFMPLDNSPQNLSDAVSATGQKHFILAFVLAPNSGGGCTPMWDGSAALTDDAAVQAQVNAVRGAGGDVGVSFGGYNGTELGAACGSASALAGAYQQVIDRYNLDYVDFDIEGDDLGALSSEQMRFQAISQLESTAASKGRYLTVALTIPVATVGLTGSGVDEVRAAHDLGTRIDYFNIMDFDYGGSGSDQVNADITVADDVHSQLKSIYTTWSDADTYAHTGITLMNGHTDQPSELFTQSTFSSLLGYVQQHNVGFFSYWSLNRDRPCDPNGNYGWVAGVCSSISQQPWDFTKIIAQRDSGGGPGPTPTPTPTPSPTPTPTPTPTPIPTPTGSCTAPAYSNSQVYTGGQQVSYNGHTWTAKWWTQGEAPSTGGSGVWQDDGPCGGSGGTPTPTSTPTPTPTSTPTATATPTPTPTPTMSGSAQPWAPNVAYTVGDEVTYNGVTYKCLQSHTSQVGWEPPNAPALWQPE